jgi:CheY-like chemotaxis protein/two-component sensor histidine kinase
VAEDLAHRAGVAVENAVLYRSAVEADRRKDDFLAVLSHELRTPLNAIVGWSQILREGPTEPEVLRKALDTIHRNAQIQTQLISDLLDISRVSTGKMRLDVRTVELKPVVDAAVDALKPAATAKRIRVETDLDPGAGPISGDAGRLQQIVWNLVANAIKFVPDVVGRVTVRTVAADSHVHLSVEDNGPGLDPAFLPYAFEPFRQADGSTNRRYQGLGLGLAIVRQLVELHGGLVRVANRLDSTGAVFTVELPRQSVARAITLTNGAMEPLNLEQPMWLDTAPSLRNVRILVVDDQEDARDMLQAVLERCGARVTLASSAAEALAILPRERPDVLLSDVEMPGQDGYDLLRELRSLPVDKGGEIPAVALTAYATVNDRMKVLRAGFQMHVSKPVQPAELATVVASLVRKSG